MVLPEIRLLQAAIALAEELNYSRAAERLRIEQSTLSKRIVELESQIDLRLFERNHQTVELTDAGRHFVEDARSAVLHAERAVVGARAAFHGADEVLDEFRVNVGVHVDQNALRGETLRAVRGHGVSVIEVPHLCRIECDRPIFAAVHVDGYFAALADLLDGSEVTVGDS
ncbi:MAG: LysR family transcriptional regulator [Terracidiphilus sp.]